MTIYKNKTKNNILRVFLEMFVLLIFILLIITQPVFAALPLTQKDIDYINKRQLIRDAEEPALAAGCSSSEVGQINTVYMIGDSITEGSETELSEAFRSIGADSTINGLSSRSLSSGDDPKDGLTVLESSVDEYAEAQVIVVALGTNGGLTTSGISDAISIIRESNSDAKIFWVNIGVDNSLRDGSRLSGDTWNNTLKSSSADLDFTVVDWANIVESRTDSGIITDDGLGVHPTDEGKKLFAQTILADIAGSSSSSNCSVELTGSDNPEKVWNYMISKGLTATQAAGFMGNMQAEAGFEPRRVEYPTSGDPWSSADYPDSLSDTVPPCLTPNCRPGYGIVQWTAPSRKDNLRAYAAETGKGEGDLGLQLDFVWQEISESPYSYPCNRSCNGAANILAALELTNTVEEATNLILRSYEIPANIDAAYTKRIGFANAWFVRFGSGGSQ